MTMYRFTNPSGYIKQDLDIETVLDDMKVFMRQPDRFVVRIHSTRKGAMKKITVRDNVGHVWTYRKVQ